MGLQRYKQKRNFNATPEPAGKVAPRQGKALMFVIQKHDATRLHYDFRLEMEGVLKSWAVPKGVPTTKGDRRLAMFVEDHPLDYGGFEGVIPEGNYGAGSVMVWDTGTWEPLGGDPAADLRAGKLHFALHGRKLDGEWTLVRMRARSESSGKDEWLLIKSGEDVEPITAKKDDESVVSHRTMAEIAGQKTRTWQSNRPAASAEKDTFKARVASAARRVRLPAAAAKPASDVTTARKPRGKSTDSRRHEETAGKTSRKPTVGRSKSRVAAAIQPPEVPIATDTAAVLRKCPAETPRFLEPMKAQLVEAVPRENWVLELKHDGYRALAIKDGASVKLYSRNHRDITAEFEPIASAVRKIAVDRAVLDGEIVALDESGHGSFQLLQNRGQIGSEGTLVYYLFDLLNLDGRNVRDLPLTQRREMLQPIVAEVGEPLRFSVALNGAAEVVLKEVKRLGLEGIIAKRPESKYEAGRRSAAWMKLKCVNEQEFVIGGYTPPKGSRDFFGALLVGYFEDEKLVFASKVGSGYSQNLLRQLHKKFQSLRRDTCPFSNLPTRRTGKFGQGVTAAEMKRCTWLEPALVAQVRFTEWTSDGGLRHPVFLGLREDKAAKEVTKERAQESASEAA